MSLLYLLVSGGKWMEIAGVVFGGCKELDAARVSVLSFAVSVHVCVSVVSCGVSASEILVCVMVLTLSGCGGSGVVGVERVAWWTELSVEKGGCVCRVVCLVVVRKRVSEGEL